MADDRTSGALDYADPRLPFPRRWRRGSLLFVVAILVATIVVWVIWGSDIAGQVEHRWLVSKCMNLHRSPSVVVYEEQPHRATDLIKIGYRAIDSWSEPFGAMQNPTEYRKLFRKESSYAPTYELPIIFLGERRTPSGQALLVLIRAVPDGDEGIQLAADSYIPGSALSRLKPKSRMAKGSWRGTAPTTQPARKFLPFRDLRVFAGQRDANDAGRMTFRFEWEEARYDVAGQLADDGSVNFKLIGSAAK